MPTPRRRSSRIKSDSTPAQARATPVSKLSSLLERDESPPSGPTVNIDALVSSPAPPPNTVAGQSRFENIHSAMKTPQTANRLYPPREEMHPSKVQQSTIKQSPSRLHFGNTGTPTALSPSKSGTAAVHNTPSRIRNSLPQNMTSPSFDFSFERPETDLSVEAQKIMDSVRDEAAKIKAQMMEERNKQEHKDGETETLYGVGGRKINKAKGKAGRYSDIHKQEFKKMDSIVNHASVWKNKIEASASSLKRSPSKAGLEQPEMPLQRTKSFKSLNRHEPSERLENTAPGKRAKRNDGDDTSNTRPVSRDADTSTQTMSAKIKTSTGLPSAITTPTKASLARSASVKSMKTSMIPSISRSASTKTLNIPMPKTEGSTKYLSSLSRFSNMKSILQRAHPKFSNDPVKIAAGTHLPLQQGSAWHLEADFPELPPDSPPVLHRSPAIKRVNFNLTPSGKSRTNLSTADSPSPSKIPTPYAQPQSEPEVSTSPPITTATDSITYPNLANSPNITTRTKIPRAATPGDFTFRTDKTINFSPSKPPTSIGTTTVTSPGSTIRHVRPSGVPTHVLNFDDMPKIPHGMPNKKRSRPEPDSAVEDEENVDPMATTTTTSTDETDYEGQSRAKKQRMSDSPPKQQQAPHKKGFGTKDGSRIPKSGAGAAKKKGLSLGRLHMLSRPKERR